MAKFDLHIHTTLSDGDLSPIAIIEKAKREGLETICITDHETIISYDFFKDFADIVGINLICGVEINVGDHINFHFLGYNIQNIPKLENFLRALKKENEGHAYKTIELLEKHYGIKLNPNELLKKYSKDILDKKAIAKEMISKGYCKKTKEVYDNYIGRNTLAYSKNKKITAKEVIELIHECGGVCVWAHPNFAKYKTPEGEKCFDMQKIDEVCKKLKSCGLDGIEINSITSNEQASQLAQIANKYNLVITSGSDFHSMTCGHTLGSPNYTQENFDKLTKLFEQRKQIYNQSILDNDRSVE